MEDEITPPSHRIYQGDLVSVGLFRCPPNHPLFNDSGPTYNNLLVFPRTCVAITHEGRETVVASPNIAMLYNPKQIYRRGKLSESGDRCEWFTFHPDLLVNTLKSYDPWVEDHPESPFYLTHAPSDAGSYLLQRMVVEHILSCEVPDRLFIEETSLQVLERILYNAYRPANKDVDNQTLHRDLIRDLKSLLATRFQEPLTLEAIATELHYSPFYLCRIFRKSTGTSIHRYLNQIRLRTSLEWIIDGESLTDLSHLLGYSSHSHFTQAFRKEFGLPPSALRGSQAFRQYPERSTIRARF